MPTILILGGLACGTLLVAGGAILWDSYWRVPRLSRAVQVVGWLAAVFLLLGALLAWWRERSFSTPALRLTLMAALAAPPTVVHRRRDARWSDVMHLLPALLLTGGGILHSLQPIAVADGPLLAAPIELVLLTCGGIGARVLGAALAEIAGSTPDAGWPGTLVYTLLTLLTGGTALTNLWQRGMMWNCVEISRDGCSSIGGGLAGAWLAWSATRLGPRQHPRLRAVLVAVAALSLIAVALT